MGIVYSILLIGSQRIFLYIGHSLLRMHLQTLQNHFRLMYLVVVVHVPVKMSADQMNNSIINSLNRLNNFHLIVSNDTALAGNPAHIYFYTHVLSPVGKISVIEVWMLKDNKTYSIIFSALPDQLPNYISTLKRMVDSFKLQ